PEDALEDGHLLGKILTALDGGIHWKDRKEGGLGQCKLELLSHVSNLCNGQASNIPHQKGSRDILSD
ncbi:hypothetical protein PSW56_23120, partial [Shigella flexneri]|nr:hypothetical protein [Shigella flexneri]